MIQVTDEYHEILLEVGWWEVKKFLCTVVVGLACLPLEARYRQNKKWHHQMPFVYGASGWDNGIQRQDITNA